MSFFYDRPFVIIVTSIVILVALAVGWITSGRKPLLYLLIGYGVLAIALIAVERFVVTDREQIDLTLRRMARSVASNDPQRIASHISSSAPQLQQKATSELPNYKFESLRITKVHEIDVNSDSQPPTATVDFNIVAKGNFRVGSDLFPDQSVPRWVQLQLVKDPDGEWRIVNYEHAEPTRSMMLPDLQN